MKEKDLVCIEFSLGINIRGKIPYPFFNFEMRGDTKCEAVERFSLIDNRLRMTEVLGLTPARTDLLNLYFMSGVARRGPSKFVAYLQNPLLMSMADKPIIGRLISGMQNVLDDYHDLSVDLEETADRWGLLMQESSDMNYRTFIEKAMEEEEDEDFKDLLDEKLLDGEQPEILSTPVGDPRGIKNIAHLLSSIYLDPYATEQDIANVLRSTAIRFLK